MGNMVDPSGSALDHKERAGTGEEDTMRVVDRRSTTD